MTDLEQLVEKLVRDAGKKFGKSVLPSDNVEFISFVHNGRARLLKKAKSPLTPRIREFVRERLSRCGLESFAADFPSVSELWDIFDDYEFQVLMGRIP